MPSRDRDTDPSTEILLAEHERLSALFLYNSDLGEKRTAAYLTVVSLAGAGILGLSQLNTDQSTVLEINMAILAGIFLLGFITFLRLVERRIRNTEYLRAINRIHAYFANNDATLVNYFSWPVHDDYPKFSGSISDFTALRDIIAIMNAVSFGVMFALFMHLLTPEPRSISTGMLVVSTALGLSVLAAHMVIETVILRRAERRSRANIRFPQHAQD